MIKINEKLYQLYIEHKILPTYLLKQAFERANLLGKRLDLELIESMLVTEMMNAIIYADFFNLPFQDLSLLTPDPLIVQMVTEDFIDREMIIPVCKIDSKILVAIANPFQYDSISKIHSFVYKDYHIVVTSKKQIEQLKNLIFSRLSTVEAIYDYSEMQVEMSKDQSAKESELYGADIKNAPAVRLVDSLFQEAIANKASDIHIEPFEKEVKVRLRIDGVLQELSTFDMDLYPAILTRIKIISGINITKKKVPQDGRIKHKANNKFYDFRVSTLPTIYGERAVIRILDTDTFSFEKNQLGFLKSEIKFIDKMLAKPNGIILLTGPTGCGKTTTLYSFIKEFHSTERNIITVEDPVEYTIPGVNQIQVNTKAELTFATSLRSILRQDPNIIMIGEIRDEETAQIAFRAAITGHVVLSTLHTNNSVSSINRLIDMGVKPYFVADALTGIVAQRLVRKLCPHCKKRKKTTQEDMEILGINNPKTVYRSVGCPACNFTGYQGRIGIHEVFYIDKKIKKMIQEHASTEDITKAAIVNGMLTLMDTAREIVHQGLTSIDEIKKIFSEDQSKND